MTITQTILEFLKDSAWKWGGQIEEYVRSCLGSKGGTTSRKCRLMVEDGMLEKRYMQVDGKGPNCVQYRLSEEYRYLSSQQDQLFRSDQFTTH